MEAGYKSDPLDRPGPLYAALRASMTYVDAGTDELNRRIDGLAARLDALENAKSKAKRPKPAKAKAGGNRTAETLERVTAKPGITAKELASAMGIGPNYLYRVLPKLEKAGKVRKDGTGYYPVES